MWAEELDEVLLRVGHRFGRADLRRRMRDYVRALLGPVGRKNSWQLAEYAGHGAPHGFQNLLNRARWDADAVRDDVQAYVAERLGEPDGVLVIDETGFLLRDREIASVARYQRLFREFIADWMGDPMEAASLRAELMAASVVAAHNHVLRRWLRGESADPVTEVDEAMREVPSLFPAPGSPVGRGPGTTVVAFRTGQDIEALLPELRRLVEG